MCDHDREAEDNTKNAAAQEDSPKLESSLSKLGARFGLKSDELVLAVSVSRQELYLVRGEEVIKAYPVSTSKYGIGNEEGSNKTPLGTHRIYEKVGGGVKIGTIFKACINTGRIAKIYRDSTDVEHDFIITRIMCLEGLELGVNKGEGIDSRDRRIYIHGTPEEGLIGKPASHGCVRMRNDDVIELFDLVKVGTLVEIKE